MSADREKKAEPQNEAAPAEQNEYASRLTAQLKEMMEGFLKNCPIADKKPVKDHRRLPGSGIKNLGFIIKAFQIARLNPGFAPHYLDVTLMDGKLREMKEMMTLKNILKQFIEVVENIYFFKSNDCYNDALKYYDGLKEFAQHGEDSFAQLCFNELKPFFQKEKKLAESE